MELQPQLINVNFKNMKPKKVIKSVDLPSKLPVFPTLTTILALDYWNAPQWLWGALGFLFIIAWVAAIIRIITDVEVDIFEKDDIK